MAWSTGGGGTADADPVPSRPAVSPSAPETARAAENSESPARLPQTVPAQNEASPSTGSTGGAGGSGSADAAESATAASELDELLVMVKDHRPGPEPETFDWRADVDGNGCDTRNDVLRRDLNNITLAADGDGCIVTSGDLDDDYLGDSYSYELGSTAVDIDHIVSRSNAWQTGGAELSDEALQEFGNDPLNLLTVSSDLKRQKGGGDAATWLPPNEEYQCEYASRQVAVKHKYGLWVTSPEKDALQRVLDNCGEQPAFAEGLGWPKPGDDKDMGTQSASKKTPAEPAEVPSGEPEEASSPSPDRDSS